MNEDVKDWKNKLKEEEKAFLTNIFRFFTQGDIDVAGGYVKNYLLLTISESTSVDLTVWIAEIIRSIQRKLS